MCRAVLCRAVPCRHGGGGGGNEALCHGTPTALRMPLACPSGRPRTAGWDQGSNWSHCISSCTYDVSKSFEHAFIIAAYHEGGWVGGGYKCLSCTHMRSTSYAPRTSCASVGVYFVLNTGVGRKGSASFTIDKSKQHRLRFVQKPSHAGSHVLQSPISELRPSRHSYHSSSGK